ncbi:unnamed protein product [Linum trigynum]|uniref:Uncharacterized protein n=1 Tax=Linum trigynum TaxID=586398 RepID=A0AAV2GSV9_9ROSI
MVPTNNLYPEINRHRLRQVGIPLSPRSLHCLQPEGSGAIPYNHSQPRSPILQACRVNGHREIGSRRWGPFRLLRLLSSLPRRLSFQMNHRATRKRPICSSGSCSCNSQNHSSEVEHPKGLPDGHGCGHGQQVKSDHHE